MYHTICLLISTISFAPPQIATWQGNAEAAYTLTMDDSRETQVTMVEPIWTEHNLVGTFFINPSDNFWAWRKYGKDYWTFPSRGHELSSHTLNHYSVVLNHPTNPHFTSYEEVAADCEEVASIFREHIGTAPTTFCYPWGDDDSTEISNHYIAARDVCNYTERNGRFIPNPPTPPDMYKIGCFFAAGGNSWWGDKYDFGNYEMATRNFSKYIEDTLYYGGWAVEYSHGLSVGDRIDLVAYGEHMDELSDLSERGVIWNATFSDVSKYIYERDAAQISIVGDILTVDDHLDDNLFNVPLTVLLETSHTFYRQGETFGLVADGINILPNGVETVLYTPYNGDMDGNGAVDSRDLDVVRGLWGRVGSRELDDVRSNWTTHTVVPEPSILVLLLSLVICKHFRAIGK